MLRCSYFLEEISLILFHVLSRPTIVAKLTIGGAFCCLASTGFIDYWGCFLLSS
jgi:hypothetical protein